MSVTDHSIHSILGDRTNMQLPKKDYFKHPISPPSTPCQNSEPAFLNPFPQQPSFSPAQQQSSPLLTPPSTPEQWTGSTPMRPHPPHPKQYSPYSAYTKQPNLSRPTKAAGRFATPLSMAEVDLACNKFIPKNTRKVNK